MFWCILLPQSFLMCFLVRFPLFLPVTKCEMPKCVGPPREMKQKYQKDLSVCLCNVYVWLILDFDLLLWLKLNNDLCPNSFPYNCSTHPPPTHPHHTQLSLSHTHTTHTPQLSSCLPTLNFLYICLCMFISFTFGVPSCPHLSTLHPSLSNYLSIYISVCVLSCPRLRRANSE